MEHIEKIDWETLNNYIEKGLIIANKHPEYEIWILNYTPKTQLKGLWDDYTLSCYGMVIDKQGTILARPLPKMTQYDEKNPPKVDLTEEYNIFEKLDGTTIQIFYYIPKMQWMVISNQSFISEQGLVAQQFLNTKYNIFNILNKNYTYIFEIIYPEDYTIIKYQTKRDLILITRIDTKTGLELRYQHLLKKYSKHFTVLKKFDINIKKISDLKKYSNDNKEGFVIRFKGGFRVEYIFDNYIHLVGMVSNISNISIWRNLKNRHDFNQVADKIPEKQYVWVQEKIKEFQQQYYKAERLALKEFIRIYHINQIIDRNDFANEAIQSKYYSILFMIYDKKPYDKIIWRMIKPRKYITLENS